MAVKTGTLSWNAIYVLVGRAVAQRNYLLCREAVRLERLPIEMTPLELRLQQKSFSARSEKTGACAEHSKRIRRGRALILLRLECRKEKTRTLNI